MKRESAAASKRASVASSETGVTWRLLDCGAGAGDWNMALDRALMEALAGARRDAGESGCDGIPLGSQKAPSSPLEGKDRGEGGTPRHAPSPGPQTAGRPLPVRERRSEGLQAPIVRFYSWERPTLSLGRIQHPPATLVRRCRDLGIPVVRRPTGGKAILHHDEVTFSIVAPTAGLGSVMESYRVFARAIAAGLRRLGVEARLCDARATPPDAALLCFALPAGCDLEVGGRKLVGSAQARHAGALLQQNSLPLRLSHDAKARLFGAAAMDEARLATDLVSVLGREPSFGEIRAAIVAGFETELGIAFEAASVLPEVSATAEKMRTRLAL